jgi:hypothetical protein
MGSLVTENGRGNTERHRVGGGATKGTEDTKSERVFFVLSVLLVAMILKR